MFLDPLCRAQITKQLRCSSCPGPEGGLRRLSRTPPIKAPQLQVSGIAKWGSAPQGVTQQLAEHQHDLSNRIKTMEHFDGNATETDGHVRSPHSRNQYIRFRVSSHTHKNRLSVCLSWRVPPQQQRTLHRCRHGSFSCSAALPAVQSSTNRWHWRLQAE